MPMARYKSRTRPFRVHLREENKVNDGEDSGVHLEEPGSPISKASDDPGDPSGHSYTPRHGITITKIAKPASADATTPSSRKDTQTPISEKCSSRRSYPGVSESTASSRRSAPAVESPSSRKYTPVVESPRARKSVPVTGSPISRKYVPATENANWRKSAPVCETSVTPPDRRSHRVRQYDSLTGKMVTLDLVPSEKLSEKISEQTPPSASKHHHNSSRQSLPSKASSDASCRDSKPSDSSKPSEHSKPDDPSKPSANIHRYEKKRDKNSTTPQGRSTPHSQSLEEDEGLDVRGSNPDLSLSTKGDHSHSYSSENSDSENVQFSLGGSNADCSNGREEKFGDSSAAKLGKDSKDSKRKRFKKLLKGSMLHRSQSVGCEKDLAPEHALFLQYAPSEMQHKEQPGDSPDGPKRMIHKTCSADAAMMAAEMLPLDPGDLVKSKQKSSIAKNVRKKFQKLRRRNTDSLLGAAILTVTGASKITPGDAMEWGNSFESLLADKNGLELFRNFLKSEFSEENVEFWVACEEFKTTRTNKLVSRAQKIYSDYVALKAPRQVNLDSKTRLETVTNLENPTRDMFKQAQKRIQFLMENDSYKRFLDTDLYKRLLGPPSAGSPR